MMLLTLIKTKVIDHGVELAMAGALAGLAWAGNTHLRVRDLTKDQTATAVTVKENTRRIDDTIIEQKVTNQKLDNLIEEVRGMRQDSREERRMMLEIIK